MKPLLTVIALCALISTGALSSPAAADGRRHGSGHSAQDSNGRVSSSFFAGDRHRDGFRQRQDRRHHKLRRQPRHKRHAQRPGRHLGHRHGHFGHGLASRCHPDRRLRIGQHGERLLIGAWLCRYAHGGSFILGDSRHRSRRF